MQDIIHCYYMILYFKSNNFSSATVVLRIKFLWLFHKQSRACIKFAIHTSHFVILYRSHLDQYEGIRNVISTSKGVGLHHVLLLITEFAFHNIRSICPFILTVLYCMYMIVIGDKTKHRVCSCSIVAENNNNGRITVTGEFRRSAWTSSYYVLCTLCMWCKASRFGAIMRSFDYRSKMLDFPL